MKRLANTLARLNLAFAVIAGASLVCLAVLIFIDVFGRYLLNSPLPFAVELIELLVAITVMGALPLTSFARGHVAVDLLENAVGKGARRVLSLISTSATLVFVVLIAWQLAVRGLDQAETRLVTPILGWPTYPVIGFAMLAAIVSAVAILALLFGAEAPRQETSDWD